MASYITTAKKKRQDGRQFSKKSLKIIIEEFNTIFHRLQWQLVPLSLLLTSICSVLIMLLQYKYIMVNNSKIFIINIVVLPYLWASVIHWTLLSAVLWGITVAKSMHKRHLCFPPIRCWCQFTNTILQCKRISITIVCLSGVIKSIMQHAVYSWKITAPQTRRWSSLSKNVCVLCT